MRTPAVGPSLRLAPAQLWQLVAVARPWLAVAVAVGVGQAVLLVAQAAILPRLLADALYGGVSGHAAADDVLLIALLAVGRLAQPCGRVGPGPAAQRAGSPRQPATVALRGAVAAYPYLPGPGPVICGLDLELAPGRPVALAGPSGSGKTLVVFTLLRFADLAAGELTIDGTEARTLPPEQVRAWLAWSPEQPALFPASVRANLRRWR